MSADQADYLRGFSHAAWQTKKVFNNKDEVKNLIRIIRERAMYDDSSPWMRGWIDGIIESVS